MARIIRLSLFPMVLSLMSTWAFGQQAAVSPTPVPSEDTVKITTSSIRLDVVVTDKDKKPIRGLLPADFKVFQDGKLQAITGLSYIDSQSPLTAAAPSAKREKNSVAPPPPRATGRIITFVIDDGNCLSSWESMRNITDSVNDFVDKQMLPDDRVAIYRTKGGASLLQVYTNNKGILHEKISKVSASPGAGGMCSTFDPAVDRGGNPLNGASDPGKELAERRRENNVLGTINILNVVIDRLKGVPQRKQVFLLSEGLIAKQGEQALNALRLIADKAARSSVNINTLSGKGLTIPGMLTAGDNVRPAGDNARPDDTTTVSESRINEERQLNDGLAYLAAATGGTFVRNKTSLDTEISRVLALQNAYYLITYEPDDETFKGKDFHKIDVRVGRPDLKVISRNGFYATREADVKAVSKNAEGALYQALSSPFQENGMEIGLSVIRGNTREGGDFLRPIFNVKGADLTLRDDTNGTRKEVLDVVAVVLDEKGKVAGEFNRTYTFRVPKAGAELALRNGLEFAADIPIKKPGTYSVRVAVRVEASGRLGSASDMVEVSDAKKGFFISGLITTGVGPDGTVVVPSSRPDAGFSVVMDPSAPSVRRFTRGSRLYFTYTIYNAVTPPAGAPALTREIRLYRNGKLVLGGPEKAISLLSPADPTRIPDIGNIGIAPQVELGAYSLQIIVRDKTGDRISSQWTDFEVVP